MNNHHEHRGLAGLAGCAGLAGFLRRTGITGLTGLTFLTAFAHSAPSDQPRLQASDIVYLGSFAVPNQDSANEPLTYGGHALGFNPGGNGGRGSLYVGCHDWYQRSAEISIPSFGQTATILQGCKDVTDGKLGTLGGGNTKLGGHMVYNNRLLATAYIFYDASGVQNKSHGVGGLNLSQTTDFNGFFGFTGASAAPRGLAGYMTLIPPEWRPLFAAPALTGNGGLSIVSTTSDGPSATTFDPDAVGTINPIPGKTLVYYQYPASHPDFAAKGSILGGMAFPNNTRTVLFFGTRAQLPYCYGEPADCPGTCGSSKGPQNQFKHAFWLYDANDLLAVKSGTKQPGEIREYAVVEVSNITSGNCASVTFGGATFDQQNNILYVTPVWGETPRVHAFRIGTPGTPPPPPPPPPPPTGGQTTGGVNWLDPLGYAKPVFVPLSIPNETTVTNKYWVDMTGGSGSTCSQASPCDNMDDVIGKPGTTGGPAIIYVKGTGSMSWYQDTIYGSGDADCRTGNCSNWILVKPWPAGSPGCATECTATFNSGSNMNSPSNIHHILWDGGRDMKIRFNSNGGANTYAMLIEANRIVIHRTQQFCTGSNGQTGWAVGSFSPSNYVSFINNEFYGCNATGDQSSAVYVGPGNGGGYNNFLFHNNLVRDFFGEGIEINPRVTSNNIEISGNAIHNVGKGTCNTPWNCRFGITMSIQSGGGNNGTVIKNNLIWDTGSSCIADRGGGTPRPVIANNTCFDYAKGPNGTGPGPSDPWPQGIAGYSALGTAVITNNIIYSPLGTGPFDASTGFTRSNNLCNGSGCALPYSSNVFQSTDPNNANFLKIGSNSPALNAGANTGASPDYAGTTRPQGSAYDIGAFEFSGTPPPPPSGTRCDIDTSGATNVSDVQLCVNQVIGTQTCGTGDIDMNGSCNVVDVQRVVNAALGGTCVTP